MGPRLMVGSNKEATCPGLEGGVIFPILFLITHKNRRGHSSTPGSSAPFPAPVFAHAASLCRGAHGRTDQETLPMGGTLACPVGASRVLPIDGLFPQY